MKPHKKSKHHRWELKCEDCHYYFDFKKVSCFREGQCTRFPPSVHPDPKLPYKNGERFSHYPMVESIKETCGEFKRKKS
jgi:hypothetical protein